MMGKGLFAFIAFLAVVFESTSAQMTCDERLDCTKCLAGKNTSCAWHVSKDSSGCMSEDECNSKEGECFLGKDKASNEYICGSTCGLKSDSTCDDCLSTDYRGGRGKRSDCAWFVRGNEDPQCIYKKRCDDRGFENGRCIEGSKIGGNSKKCDRKPPPDVCPRLKNCGKCLKGRKGQSCAWQVDGDDASCVAEDKCEGDCSKSSEIFDIKKTCKRIKKPKPPDDVVGIEKCKDFKGLCTDCLNNGCAWVNMGGMCFDSCSDAPSDVGCNSLPVSEEPVDIFTRNLLRFDSKASQMCFYLKLDDKNKKLCETHYGDCEACVETQLYTAPGEFYAIPPTCHYNDKYCGPYECDWFGCGSNTCDLILIPQGTEWPELLDQTASFAIEFLRNKYGEGLLIEVLPPGSFSLTDFRLDRVRLNVDDSTPPIIIEVPRVG